ncbi:alcohol dehydrogenase [Lasiosphaeria miniovina]|uniref:Alcohol dehydrogenase n=1 Tax=Lasiosphaeria miniovina TaxID=1954250 RepID=A0AA40B6Z4_9PEZI|nr:alcohol dehydrogenase [Lasiosphaeria miniovina]KAK0728819.1 alcohol dehydrogenase [Lasiosphaeria miniovina]
MPSADPILSLPKEQTAVVAQGPGRVTVRHDAPVPALAPDMAIVRTAAVAINPADAKMLDYSATPGAIHGDDFAGTVVALGEDVLKSGRLQVGDRVAGMVHGMNKLRPDVGAFAQYVGATADLLLKIPDNMSFEDAATLGLGVTTATMALWLDLRVPATLEQLAEARGLAGEGEKEKEEEEKEEKEEKEEEEEEEEEKEGEEKEEQGPGSPASSQRSGCFVLVAGGSTATGTRAIQLLKLAGLRPIATCSPANFELVRRFGAEKAFDYRAASAAAVAAEIRAYTNNELGHALDCVATAETTQLCYGAIGRAGGRYCSLEPFRAAVAQTRALTVDASWVMAPTVFGRKLAIDGAYGRDAAPDHRRFGVAAYAAVQPLLDRALLDPHPVRLMPGGWDGVVHGIDVIRQQAVSGYKMVYKVA